MSDRPADDGSGSSSDAVFTGAIGTAAHCIDCGGRLQPQDGFCSFCGAARPQMIPTPVPSPPIATVERPPAAPLTPPTTTLAAPESPVFDAHGGPNHEQTRPKTASRRGAAIVTVIVLAVAGGAAGGILITRHRAEPPRAHALAQAINSAPVQTVTATPAASAAPSPSASLQSFADLYRTAKGGVVRIQATTCDGGGVGTGFLIAPNLVATVAHVVNDSAALSLSIGENGAGGTTSGVVVGIDTKADIALVRVNKPLRGHVFTLAARKPNVGQEVAAIGFPEGDPMTLTRGTVSGLDRTIPIEGVRRGGLIETDAAINPGNSGGPLLSADGQVVGLVDAKNTEAEGIGYAVATTIAQPRLRNWMPNTASVVSAPCATPAGPQQGRELTPTLPGTPDATTQAVGQVLKTYFDGINGADYASAWSVLSPKLQGTSWSSLAEGDATSYDDQVELKSVTSGAGSSVTAHVTFNSVQSSLKGPDGDTCDNWDLDYSLIPSGDSWLIDTVRGHNGGRTHTSC